MLGMTGSTHDSDTALRTAVLDELGSTPGVDATHIGVAVNNGAVTLAGEVDSYPEKRLAKRAALRVKGVSAVADEITVSALGEGTNDTDIARMAADKLKHADDVPETISAVVHDHTITLTGTAAEPHQLTAAEHALRYIPGVVAVYDEVALQPTVLPSEVKKKINAALLRNAQLDSNRIDVLTEPGGLVTLRGAVQSWAERHQAEQAAWSTPGVTTVVNELRIGT